MKVALFGSGSDSLRLAVLQAGFSVVDHDPELVLSYGGDGTFLKSEHAFPGVPKVLLKNSSTCRLCTKLPVDEAIRRIAHGDYSVQSVTKLKVVADGKEWHALNDVIVHNADPRHAIRFTVRGARHLESEVIGDGIVVATVFGATGYYHSVTKQSFKSGVGVAFNNASRSIEPQVIPEDEFGLSCEIIRGPAAVYADNQKDEAVLGDGGLARITLSDQQACIVRFG